MRARVIGLVALAALSACGSVSPEAAPTPSPSDGHNATPHRHGPEGEHISPLAGDGVAPSANLYSLTDLKLTGRAGEQGRLSFRIEQADGTVVRRYIPDQTKDLHLYVVSDDYAVFRHLHPTINSLGTWSTPVTLPKAGGYGVIAEFIARTKPNAGEWRILGGAVDVPSGQTIATRPMRRSNDVVRVASRGPITVGKNGRLTLDVQDPHGRSVRLGTYLGAFAHVTAFRRNNGAVTHMHPLGQPEFEGHGTTLTFHTEFDVPGTYLAFVQVRVDGFLHTLRLPLKVTAA